MTRTLEGRSHRRWASKLGHTIGPGRYLCYGCTLLSYVSKTVVLDQIQTLGRKLRFWEVVLGSNHRWVITAGWKQYLLNTVKVEKKERRKHTLPCVFVVFFFHLHYGETHHGDIMGEHAGAQPLGVV